ncbi:MAG: FAD-binding oxidoreductase [Bdellovibrionales bacterium]|nr:FAD-binding oxidoreductase [Bdellovibrionales bacterium]
MMKWWGWGSENMSFPMENKPNLWPWIRNKLGIQSEKKVSPIELEKITLAAPVLNEAFVADVRTFLNSDQIKSDKMERLLHSYGKSFPDLFRVRRGEVKRAPDMILLPNTHQQVEKIVQSANKHNVCVIPFGGGTNIVGGVEPRETSNRMVVTLNLREMNKLISVDPYSMTATIQAGALGPKLEADLAKKGFNLGHYPDSFEYSTLGGWLATRSAGMQSDAYGKIEDMVVSLKMVTPAGTIVTRTTPASSAGPDLNRIVCGSEGTLGVITEATMRVHRSPKVKDYRGFLFPTFEDGVAAIHETLERGFTPSMIRLQDAGETELAFQMKAPKKGIEGLIQKPIKAYLKAKGYTAPCILIVGFEGGEDAIQSARSGALSILKKHKGFPLGKGVGKTWSADKFNVPYLRDYVMDYSCTADVAETAATWANVMPLYNNTIEAVKAQFAKDRGHGYVGCHISHTYKTGACLYFTWAVTQVPGKELEQYYTYKMLVTDTFMKSGGTLSHHHAIGYEHLPWMEEEVSKTGLTVLRGLKSTLDPKRILNPGKLIPEEAGSETTSAADITKMEFQIASPLTH